MINQDPSHRLCGQGKEVTAILGGEAVPLGEPKIGFVHQGCRTERMPGALVPKLSASQGAELVINERQQLIERPGIAVAQSEQTGRYGKG